METELAPLLKRIERYMKREQLHDTVFGVRAASTPNLLMRLRSGNVTLKTLKRVQDFLKENRA
jgi:hypothetical protein